MKILDFTKVFLGVSAMIGDRGIDLSAYGRKERHQGAEAVPLDANFARTFRQFRHGFQSVLNISDAGVTIIRLIKTKPVLPVSLRRDVRINAWLLTPEQIGRNATKPCSANSSHVLRMSALTPNNSSPAMTLA